MKPIRVPKTPRSSFNKDRRPSKLLLDQIEHLEWAALPAWQRKPRLLEKYRKRRVRTEQQAAERIAQLTEMVRQAKAEEAARPASAGTRPKVVLPPLPGTVRAKARKKRATRAGTTRKAARSRTAARTTKTKKTPKGKTAKTKKKAAKKTVRRRR